MSGLFSSLFQDNTDKAEPLQQVTASDVSKREKIVNTLCEKRHTLEEKLKHNENMTDEEKIVTAKELADEREKMEIFGISATEYEVYLVKNAKA